ncbi:LysR family transcriptional regulator [Ruegeria sp. ANG-S4]|uniref:LysR family transcriptional regulator n=1 Tax=Ruegeria sp. ANG-S4 TaxID=1577904 RepID=UPI00057ED3F5|nr:LysR family transcriptional regulator [Ruegeria sp. ANG-S4]KIC45940.1 LysR family transcriptional regulator [Ruegeria sp. ANG-S4]
MDEINWDDLKLFLAVARAGGLGPAEAATGKSAPTLGRRMLQLERRLGQELFVRKPRGYDLTEDGLALLDKINGIEERVLDLVDGSAVPLVKVSAGTWVTRALIQSADTIRGSTPVRLRFMSAEEVVDIGRREAVIGIRNHRPDGVGLACRRIGKVSFAVYAGNPKITTWARVVSSTPSALWVSETQKSADSIEVTTPQNALDLALAGIARAVLPTFIGDAQPGLIAVSDRIEELNHSQWMVTHHEDRFLPEVRGVIDRTYAVLRRICDAG